MKIINSLKLSKWIYSFLIFSIILSTFFYGADPFEKKDAKAAEPCLITLNVVFRDGNGDFIPSLPFQIWEQEIDADDNPVPKRSIASLRTNQYTGKATKTWTYNWPNYLLKVYDKNVNVGEFYFYDAITPDAGAACGATIDLEYDISSINFVLRDSQGELRQNTAFNLYTQKNDADGNPIIDKKVSSYNTGLSGEVNTYVVDKKHSLKGDFPGYYVIEIPGLYGSKFYKYGVYVKDGEITEVNYRFSDIAFKVVDSEDIPFPSGSPVVVYKQSKDLDGEPTFGARITTLRTDDKGVAVFEYPEGTYAAQVTGGNGQIYRYYNLQILEQKRSDITLKSDDTFISEGQSCSDRSIMNVVPRSANNDILPGLVVELYKQEKDANGKPLLTTRVATKRVDTDGQAELSFNPDPRTIYGMKIYETNPNLGDFVFYDSIKFSCDEDKDITKTLSSIKFIIRDPNGQPLKNQGLSLYVQKNDIDGNPIQPREALVKSLKTNSEGYTTAYLADEHPFNNAKKGVYSMAVTHNGKKYQKFNIKVDEGEETVFEYRIPKASDGDDDESDYTPPNPGATLLSRLKGYILLQVEERGEAWYVDNETERRYYMKDGPTAYEMMRKFGLGIATADLEKIPIGIDDRFEDNDTDGDGLADKMEEALGADIYDSDSDDDGFSDGDEVRAGYSPVSTNKNQIYIDNNLVNRLRGKILLQVESRGEAWYLNPADGNRYYMKDGPAAYQIMRFLSLGITNQDLEKISTGSL